MRHNPLSDHTSDNGFVPLPAAFFLDAAGFLAAAGFLGAASLVLRWAGAFGAGTWSSDWAVNNHQDQIITPQTLGLNISTSASGAYCEKYLQLDLLAAFFTVVDLLFVTFFLREIEKRKLSWGK